MHLARLLALPCTLVILAGCPVSSDPPNLELNIQDPAHDANPGSPMGGPGGPGGALSLAQVQARFSQQELAALEHVTISGVVSGAACTKTVRIDAIEREIDMPPQPEREASATEEEGAEGGEMRGPLTVIELQAPGPFEGLLPKGQQVVLSALCDQDGDGRVAPPHDLIALEIPIGLTEVDIEGVEIVLGAFPAPTGQGPAMAPPGPGSEPGPPAAGDQQPSGQPGSP